MKPELAVLHPASALASVGGDADSLIEIAGLVRAAWPTLLSNLRKDLAAANFGALEADARLTRVAAEYVAAGRAYLAALQLQVMALHRDLDGARRATENLEGEVTKLQTALAALQTPADCPPCASSLALQPGEPHARVVAGRPVATARRSGAIKETGSTDSDDDPREEVWGWLEHLLSFLGFRGFKFDVDRRKPEVRARPR